MKDLRDISCLVLDNGFFVAFAQELANYYGTVYYYTEQTNEYPKFKDTLPGYGLEGVERVNNLWEVLDDVDIVAIPDVFYGDMTDWLRKHKYNVWGGGMLEQLETERLFLKTTLEDLKLPVNEWKNIISLKKLREYLRVNEERYIKGAFRGDFETWHHKNIADSNRFLIRLERELFAGSEIYPFMTETPIVAIEEVGIDTYSVNGKHPDICQLGVEIKDKSYACYLKAYKDIPKTITQCVDALMPLLKEGGYAQFISTENRVDAEKVSYLIDVTARLGSPSGGSQLKLLGNLGDIVRNGAYGIMTQPEYKFKYAVEIFLRSGSVADDSIRLEIDDDNLKNFAFRSLVKINDTYHILPHQTEMSEIGTCIGTGNTLDECKKNLKEHCEALDGFDIEYDLEAGDKAVTALEEAIDKKII